MDLPRLVPAPEIAQRDDNELLERAQKFYENMQQRRTIRDFSDRMVSREVIEYCLRAAGTAPSGANLQPWHFVAVSASAVKKGNPGRGGDRREGILPTARSESVA